MFIAAHRGTRIHAPENSLRALISGYTAGAEVLEFDLQLTRDGHVVLSHDGTVNRMTADPGPPRRVLDLTLSELRALDYSAGIGSPGLRDHRGWPSSFVYHRADEDRVGILTFDEALDALPSQIPRLIELKYDSSVDTGRGDEFTDAVLATLRSHDAVAGSVVYAMDPAVVRRIRTRAPDLRVCAFDYRMDISQQIGLMRELDADGLVVQFRDMFDERLELTPFGRAFSDEYERGELRVGAVLYPFRGPGVPWVITQDEYARMQEEHCIWSCATDSMLDVESYFRGRRTVLAESFRGGSVDTARIALGYAKANRHARVYQDDGVHVVLEPYEEAPAGAAGTELEGRVDRLEEQMHSALKSWPTYSGGGLGVVRGVIGDFAAEVEYELREPMSQAITLEMAVVNVDPGEYLELGPSDNGQDTFFDPHGAPPYVGVEHDENDGYRINCNLGHEYESNRYGRPVGDGQTPRRGRLRLERRGAWFAAYFRNDVEAPDWICVGAARNDSLNERVFLRCVAKRWRQRRSGTAGYWPLVSNEVVFRNLQITVFGSR